MADYAIAVDRITARVLKTIAPSRLEEIKKSVEDFRKSTRATSKIITLDKTQIGHEQVRELKIKVTRLKVETDIYMKGVAIRNGRQVFYNTKLPETVIASLKGVPANDVIATDILEGHTISFANDDEIRLREEDWIPIRSIAASGPELQKITMPEFLNAVEGLGITEIDYAGFRYISQLRSSLR